MDVLYKKTDVQIPFHLCHILNHQVRQKLFYENHLKYIYILNIIIIIINKILYIIIYIILLYIYIHLFLFIIYKYINIYIYVHEILYITTYTYSIV